jgi:hypothetical protein
VIGTRRALIALALIVAALGVAVAVDLRRGPAATGRELVPGLDPDRVTRFAAGGEALVRRDGTWTWERQPRAPVDAQAISDALAALRAGRWHRTGDGAGATASTTTLAADGRTIAIGLGAAVEGVDQRWIVADGTPELVDGWIARALDVVGNARPKRPRDLAAEPGYQIVDGSHALSVGGRPRHTAELWLDPALVAAVEDAVGALRFDPAPVLQVAERPPAGPVIAMRGERLYRPAAPSLACARDQVEIVAGYFAGCVASPAWDEAARAMNALFTSVDRIADRRPSPIDPVAIALPGGTIDLAKRPVIDGKDADPPKLVELLAALAAPAEVVAKPTGAATATIELRDRSGQTIALDLHDGVVVRRGEVIGLRPALGAWQALARPAAAYRDDTLWREEPTTIRTIRIDDVTYTRGAVIGEWTRSPAGSVDGATIEAIVGELGSPHAPGIAPPASFHVAHLVGIITAPPAGPPVTHMLEIAASCAARADGADVQLPAALCAKLR